MQRSVRIVHGLEDPVVFVVSQCLQSSPASIEKREHRPDPMPEIFDLSAV
jgi:hypothetical protein